MGYCMSQNESKFHIKAADKDLALCAIKALIEKKGSFDWIDTAMIKSSYNLTDVMNECCWDVEEDGAGNIIGIAFAGEKAGDD